VNPVAGVGLIFAFPATQEFRGTCFAYKEPWFWITARHVLEGLTPGWEPGRDEPGVGVAHASRLTISASRVVTHTEADLAVVIAGSTGDLHIAGAPVEPFETISAPFLGSDFWAFGYPIDQARGAPKSAPTPRLFKGHVQRVLSYEAPPFTYGAAEISFPAPRGLSGGPMFDPNDRGRL
jgi:hypothetical protein